jgi:hypothetical protein
MGWQAASASIAPTVAQRHPALIPMQPALALFVRVLRPLPILRHSGRTRLCLA